MSRFVKSWLLVVRLFALLGSALGCRVCAASYEPCTIVPPAPAREFRAAWIATVGNIDWPSTNAITTEQKKSELLVLLDRAANLGLNAVMFQVRPSCDAMYASKIEPWSEYLTGTMGKAPNPFFDPLEFAIIEAHARGLELHAWFNPFRARFSFARSPISAMHVSKTHPEYVRKYGHFLWLDPGDKEVQRYSLNVVLDVLRRYDVDGIHFDDYFYPYKEKDAAGKSLDFPDLPSWRRYGAPGKLSREDWRRENVNTFVRRVYQTVKTEKPWVKFGISPFGIWRPTFPPQVRGLDAFTEIYADSRKWLSSGWVDYLAPQLYWSIDSPGQSFPVLLKWWCEQNIKHRPILAGIDSTKANGPWKPQEILNQVRLTRQQPGASGEIFWNLKTLAQNSALSSALKTQFYPQPALVPATGWLHRSTPGKPRLSIQPGINLTLRWQPSDAWIVRRWVVQMLVGKDWVTQIKPAGCTSLTWKGAWPSVIAVSAVDRFGSLGPSACYGLLPGKLNKTLEGL